MIEPAADPIVATVIGGSGFLGRYVVREMARAGWRVRVASRRPDRAEFLRPLGSVGQIVPVFTDIGDDDAVRSAVRGASRVVNLVGILAERGRRSFQALHVDGAGRVAAAAAELGVRRLLHVSALGADLASPSRYAQTKAAGEAAVRAAFPAATIFRPSVVFGPEDGLFNRFAGLARFQPALPLFGGGGTRFQPVYVGDVAAAAMAALTAERTAGQLYQLGGPRIYTLEELFRLTLAEISRRRILLPLPWWAGRIAATMLSLLPNPPLTRDQLRQLERDNVVAPGARGLADLGIAPTPAEVILPTYLGRYRPGGGRK